MSKRELFEQGAAGTVGVAGVAIPHLQSASEFFIGITPIASFFLILVPTGIWAWARAIERIKKNRKKD